MQLTFFVVDRGQQLRRISSETAQAVWKGSRAASRLDHDLDDELRLVTVLCEDEHLMPKMCFFLRTELKDGHITDESRFAAYDAMTAHQQSNHSTAATDHQLAGWPPNWQQQLAVALDVPAVELQRVGIGGPLLMADLWGMPIDRILAYFDEACSGD